MVDAAIAYVSQEVEFGYEPVDAERRMVDYTSIMGFPVGSLPCKKLNLDLGEFSFSAITVVEADAALDEFDAVLLDLQNNFTALFSDVSAYGLYLVTVFTDDGNVCLFLEMSLFNNYRFVLMYDSAVVSGSAVAAPVYNSHIILAIYKSLNAQGLITGRVCSLIETVEDFSVGAGFSGYSGFSCRNMPVMMADYFGGRGAQFTFF